MGRNGRGFNDWITEIHAQTDFFARGRGRPSGDNRKAMNNLRAAMPIDRAILKHAPFTSYPSRGHDHWVPKTNRPGEVS